MKSILLLLLGAAIGVASLYGFSKLNRQPTSYEKFTTESRSLLVDSIIDSLESIEDGDIETSQIILASAVNSQIITIRKMQASSNEERDRAEKWAERMLDHNRKLNLRVDYKE
ncbi:hypothetical protein [Luteimonas sp. R10]|uniref:hypothetical protein n=1 Tax=Luteimonas sp. R10 TaxID=3108176 RepID=UPI0030887B78|nr:hypothetical protein U3649_16710 [Luteimonas sp. R10]